MEKVFSVDFHERQIMQALIRRRTLCAVCDKAYDICPQISHMVTSQFVPNGPVLLFRQFITIG